MWLKWDDKDPLDRLCQKELRGEPILFDEWERVMDELAEEPDTDEMLAKKGLSREQVLRDAAVLRSDFLQYAAQHDFPLTDRFLLCQRLAEAAAVYSDELLRFFCQIICDTGFLLDLERTDRSEDEDIAGFLCATEDAGMLYRILRKRRTLSQRFREVTLQSCKKSLPKADCDTEKKHLIFQSYFEIIGAYGDERLFLDNIDQLLQITAGSAALQSIAPLFLYTMLTRHGKRLHTSDSTRFDLRSLWKYKQYQLDTDNGKNYKTALTYLALFQALCELYADEPMVDLELCCYGFSRLSNLCEFYYAAQPAHIKLTLPEPIEELAQGWVYSCFEHGHGDNTILTDNEISVTELEEFETSAQRRKVRALDKISDYMNRHAAELAAAFHAADANGVRKLCAEILENTSLTVTERPNSIEELSLFLASINGGLMELLDGYAGIFLIEAGKRLAGEESSFERDD